MNAEGGREGGREGERRLTSRRPWGMEWRDEYVDGLRIKVDKLLVGRMDDGIWPVGDLQHSHPQPYINPYIIIISNPPCKLMKIIQEI
jgi:hypothetical protein